MATTDKRVSVTELDFDDIKTNLKTFMRNQNEFTDYDFEGSGINALLDVLAYNTHYLAMNVNMVPQTKCFWTLRLFVPRLYLTQRH